jgi:hypothetical protein
VPNGTYTKVFVEVDSVNGTLTDGSSADVKLPSNRLQLNGQFTVGNGQEVDFVFDITVFERGPNGYILKPVAGESGTGDEVPIDDVDERGNESEGDDSDENDSDDGEADLAALNASFVGNASAGANATVEATRDGSAVENATVEVAQEVDGTETTETYTTGANGTVTFAVDANATELSIAVTAGDDDVELEREFEGDGSAVDSGNGNGNAAMRFAVA